MRVFLSYVPWWLQPFSSIVALCSLPLTILPHIWRNGGCSHNCPWQRECSPDGRNRNPCSCTCNVALSCGLWPSCRQWEDLQTHECNNHSFTKWRHPQSGHALCRSFASTCRIIVLPLYSLLVHLWSYWPQAWYRKLLFILYVCLWLFKDTKVQRFSFILSWLYHSKCRMSHISNWASRPFIPFLYTLNSATL